jgi:hypothetical protein
MGSIGGVPMSCGQVGPIEARSNRGSPPVTGEGERCAGSARSRGGYWQTLDGERPPAGFIFRLARGRGGR